jgi:hypothetical protein
MTPSNKEKRPFPQSNLYAFATLVEKEPQLFTHGQREELLHLTDTYPEDTKELSENLLAWCESNPPMMERLEFHLFRDLDNGALAHRIPPNVKPNFKEAERICIDTLRNALQTSNPAPTTTTPPPSATVPTNQTHAPR